MADPLDLGVARRAHLKKKAELDAALDQISKTGGTSHSLIGDVWRARRINHVIGFGMLTPWQLGELDEESIAVFDALNDLERRKADDAKSKQEFERVLANTRARHPTYRKHR